ncbi:MAG: hypothetical protein EA343_21380 [Nodularia sp. (in: Bacteria)]|nr:MAG: hypothetical protein EA343_21380 [Nodularia sp. (in: cyanobacteria)]
MVDINKHSQPKLLGAGRSGKVYLVNTSEGQIARKIFFEDKIANLIHYFFFGVPNPYVWNQNALSCAFYRRKILKQLVKFWFGSQLRVADAFAMGWNEEFKAYQLDTEFIQGRHVELHQPFNQNQDEELRELVHVIMIPLQKLLIKSGFDGLVWQAGKGSPTALNNFLLESHIAEKYVFVFIDCESGVPALFPINFFTLFSFYLPKAFKHRSPLFDHVDINKLKQYISQEKVNLEDVLGTEEYLEILEQVEHLEYNQKKWKSMRRFDRSIKYQLHKGSITEEQANWFSQYPLIWYIRELGKIISIGVKFLIISLPSKIFKKLKTIHYRRIVKQLGKFFFSQRYRLKIARDYVSHRILAWQKRGQLKSEEADNLFTRLSSENASAYLTDFGVHLGIKGFLKGLEILILPILYSTGIINEIVLILWFALGGPIYRSIYTSWRMIEEAREGREVPWLALIVGLLPTVGILAYPCQMIYSATGKRSKLSQFIVYDFFTRLGAKIPAWGGEDTLTEHFFNNCADNIVRWFKERG